MHTQSQALFYSSIRFFFLIRIHSYGVDTKLDIVCFIILELDMEKMGEIELNFSREEILQTTFFLELCIDSSSLITVQSDYFSHSSAQLI
jgi:hypothetical protein